MRITDRKYGAAIPSQMTEAVLRAVEPSPLSIDVETHHMDD